MKKIALLISTIFFLSSNSITAQNEDGGTFLGVNVGGYLANKNTAMMYSGGSAFSLYGIEWAMNHQFYKPDIDNYFQYSYQIEELPNELTYLPSFNIGGIAGIHFDGSTALYIEANVANLKVQDAFVVGINDPNNQSPEPTYQQVPVFGEEQRLNVNLGLRFNVYENEQIMAYVPVFGNFNNVQLERNYFVLNNRTYPIVHNIQGITNERPGGSGFGGGSGIGLRYGLTDAISVELNYNLMYSRITMLKEEVSVIGIPFIEWGLQHSALVRIIWG